jgi:Fungal Zn(2)-Cys(6) binuclear cluster domain
MFSGLPNKITRGHSCLSCQQRKVRCDGQRPCSTCTKTGDACAPAKSSKTLKRRDAPVSDRLLSRLKRCEELLQAHGIKIEDDLTSNDRHRTRDMPAPASNNDDGQMIVESGHSRYLEKYGFPDLSKSLPQSRPDL